MQCLRCQHKNRPQAKFCEECARPLDGATRTAPSYADLKAEVEGLRPALGEALEQQTATAEILRVISRSPNDVQPVFDSIAASALRLCDAKLCTTFTFDGELIHLVASHHVTEEGAAAYRDAYPSRPGRASGTHRAILTRSIVHIPDIREDPEYELRALARANDYGCVLAVPMLRDGHPVGAITVGREAARPFPSEQIELLRTFAQQAVIAIENVRLFTELQARNRDLTAAHAELTETLEQQTATSDILRVISRSPTDVRPVFEAIAENAARLCNANDAQVLRVEEEVLRLVAAFGAPSMPSVRRLTRGHLVGRAVIDRKTIHVRDLAQALAEYPETTAAGYDVQSALAVPLLREGVALGVIRISRTEIRPFTDNQIALLQTFADQAVIAIENVRLFTELQASNRELTTALDTQTATSDILRVISRSQTDVQPVFDAIVSSAVRLLRARSGTLSRIVGDQIELAAHTSTDDAGDAATRAAFPQPLSFGGVHAQTIRDRAPLNIVDAQTDPRLPEATHTYARVRGYRSQGAVPMLRHDEAVGAIAVTRHEPGGFTDDEIVLLQTFADQAVIAIENVRLFHELHTRTLELTRSVEQLTALRDVGHAVTSSLELETVLNTIVARAVELAGASSGTIWEYDATAEEFVLRITQNVEDPELLQRRTARVRRGEGAVGRLALTGTPVQIPDITTSGAYQGRLREALLAAGTRALLAIPLLHEDRLLGGLVMSRRTPGEFPREVVDVLIAFATQSALAIQNARLFREIEVKSSQLEEASQHKSEFLANMSHELRTPLNAIIGFSEVLLQRMFGDLNPKQDEYLKDIYASGQHLLSLINDILDLSKIEAGRMEVAPAPFHLPTALENAVTLVKERAGRHGIALQLDIDPRLGEVVGDERKVKQVLLNLLSNAVKFTPEGGRISLKAGLTDGAVRIAVTDTGIGIASEDQAAIFEEFRQVGSDETRKQEGTGLGLTLAKKFVELHGGKIWVESDVGRGSTFTFTLPVS